MSFTMAYYFTTFVVIGGLLMMLEAVIPVNGQCTVQGCESRDPLISIVEEIQQLRVELFDELNKQVQGIHELLSASFQDIRSEIDSVKTSLQAVERRSQEQGQSIHGLLNDSLQEMKGKHDSIVASLQAVDRRSQEQEICIKQGQSNREFLNESFQEIKAGQIGSVKTILQAADRRSQEHDNCTRQGQDIRQLFNESFQVVDQRLQEHDISLKNRTHNLWALANEMKSQHDTALTSLQAIDRRLQEHDEYMKYHSQNMWKLAYDCRDIRDSGQNVSGVYRINIGNSLNRIIMDVFCDLTSPDDSWMVFQRRKDGSEVFERTWVEYANGFGSLTGEFWMGNDALHLLTSTRNYKLRIEMEDFEGQKRFAEFSKFSIASSSDNYRLTVSGYSGDAGDSLSGASGFQFSTKDADHDTWVNNCALSFHGAWWYSQCHQSNLNGLYLRGIHTSHADGIEWYLWHGHYYSLKATEMKIALIN